MSEIWLIEQQKSSPRDYSSYDEMAQRIGGTLQDGANDHDGRSKKNGPSASKDVTNLQTCAGANETSQVVSSHRDSWSDIRELI